MAKVLSLLMLSCVCQCRLNLQELFKKCEGNVKDVVSSLERKEVSSNEKTDADFNEEIGNNSEENKIQDQQVVYNIIKEANIKYLEHNIDQAEALFASNWKKYGSSLMFQQEYIKFLLKIGNYDKILVLKSISGLTAQSLVEKAQECLNIIRSGNIKDIAGLVTTSPNSKDVILATIKYNYENNNLQTAEQYISHFEKLYSKNIALLGDLKLKIKFRLKKIEEGLEILRSMRDKRELYESYSSLYDRFKQIKAAENFDSFSKLNSIGRLFNSVIIKKQSDTSFSPSIYDSLYLVILEYLVEYGCDIHYKDTFSYATRLVNIDDSENTIYNYVRAALLAQKVSLAKDILEKNESRLSPHRINALKLLIRSELQKEEQRLEAERKRREEQERYKAEERERMLRSNSTHKAGTDFLNYYRVLGANKSSSQEDLKKCHRRKMKAISKKSAKILKPEEREKEMQSINKAFQVLSDPDKKKAYDFGIDPDAVPQQQNQNYHRRSNGHHSETYFEGGDFQDIFEQIFGGGRRSRGSRSHRQYIFL